MGFENWFQIAWQTAWCLILAAKPCDQTYEHQKIVLLRICSFLAYSPSITKFTYLALVKELFLNCFEAEELLLLTEIKIFYSKKANK